MTVKRKFFYEAGAANEGGGSGNTDVIVKKEGEENNSDTQIPQPFISAEEAKSYGFDSPDALKSFLKQKKEESVPDDVKKANDNIEKANFLKFAAENKDEKGNPLLAVEDYNQFETLKTRADRDLVFQKHLEEFKTEHPEITDEKELEEAATEDFNFEYKLKDGLSEAAKKKGEARLAKEAKELRSPIETRVTTAQSKFQEEKTLREKQPHFNKLVDELITKATPDKVALVKVKNGETDIDIEIELTKEDRAAMSKAFKTPKSFYEFINSKPEDVQKKLEDKMQSWLITNKAQQIADKSFELGAGIGTASGSNIGATNSFPLVKNGGNARYTGDETLEQSNARIAAERKKAQTSR